MATAREITALCCEDYTKHVLCGGEASFFRVTSDRIYVTNVLQKVKKFL